MDSLYSGVDKNIIHIELCEGSLSKTAGGAEERVGAS